ncbi:MAG: 30S ribosomal protein S16 [Candidatus Bostrichicola ureolyticus]|nr:MAG: 30S ribosomal protein S16 [Candidatus Bostrichicola ureolyticus]
MSLKIRLQRKGRKKKPYYPIVVIDSRFHRNGKFIEKLGFYNPHTNPSTIILNVDSALNWLQKGAKPTNTARSILSKKGVLLKQHLLKGVKKQALNVVEAENKFKKWIENKFKNA